MLRKVLNFYNISSHSRLINLTTLRNYAPRRKNIENPGIDRRMKYFKDEITENMDDPEQFESLEPEFMNLNHTHKHHEREVSRTLDKTHTLLVGRKYFKTNYPNLLTYNEKEQIKKLHADDPEEWNIDKLSESFPADPQTITLILRSKWHPKDMNRVIKHDEAVKRNWEAFKSGKLEVDAVLTEHLKKFAYRDFNELTKPPSNRKFGVEIPKPRKTEFLNIITSCKKYASEENEHVNSTPLKVRKITSDETRMPDIKPKPDENSYILQGKKEFSSKNITLEELQKSVPEIKLPESYSQISKFDEVPKLKAKEIKTSDVTALHKLNEEIIDSLEIEPKIKIPKNDWKKGKIYQVKDCFYADDGEFLYRVPGLTR